MDVHGPVRHFESIDGGNLSVSVDLSGSNTGEREVTLTEEHLNLPEPLSVACMQPRTLRLHLYEMLETRVPVEVRKRGRLPQGGTMEGVSVNPSEVPLAIRTGFAHRIKALPTAPIDLSELSESTEMSLKLIAAEFTRRPDDAPESVEVRIRVSKQRTPPKPGTPEGPSEATPSSGCLERVSEKLKTPRGPEGRRGVCRCWEPGGSRCSVQTVWLRG